MFCARLMMYVRGACVRTCARARAGVWWGANDKFVIDQNPRGFAHLIDAMVRDSVPPGDPRVVFDAHVINIEYACSGAVVTTEDGRTFKADQVISSLYV